MDILSEEEVSYYKKSLISQEGSIKKGAPGDAPVVAKSALFKVVLVRPVISPILLPLSVIPSIGTLLT